MLFYYKIITVFKLKSISHIVLLLMLLINISCKESYKDKNIIEFYTSDFTENDSLKNLQIISIDTLNNFSEVKAEIENAVCDNKLSGLQFRLGKVNYNITATSYCPNDRETVCFFNVNSIFIKNDSIITDFQNVNRNKVIKDLKIEIDSIISKDYNFRYKKDKLKPAAIHFYADENFSIGNIKRVLKEIVEQFEAINKVKGVNYFEYYIIFESSIFYKKPPPPPPPNN